MDDENGDALVTVWNYSNSAEARLGLMALNDAGIEAEIRNENTVQWDPVLDVAIGLQLRVARDDADRALEVLKRAPTTGGGIKHDSPVPDDTCMQCGTEVPDDADACPQCGWSWGQDDATA